MYYKPKPLDTSVRGISCLECGFLICCFYPKEYYSSRTIKFMPFELFLILYSHTTVMCSRHKVLPNCVIWRKNGHRHTACTGQSNKNKTPSRESKHRHLQTTSFWEAGPKGVHYSILSARLGHVQEKGRRKHASKK